MLVGGVQGRVSFCIGVCFWVTGALCLALSGISPPVVHCYIREEWVHQLHHYENLRTYFLWYLKFSNDED